MKINLETFLHLFEEELAVPKSSISADVLFRDLETWSSLNALLLISRINTDFGVLLSSSDLATCQAVRDIFNCINEQQQ
jgi:acyl carrier protein